MSKMPDIKFLKKYYEQQGNICSIDKTYESSMIGRRFLFQERANTVLSLINFNENSIFIDIGTGSGYYIFQAGLKNINGTNVTIDLSSSYLRQTKEFIKYGTNIDNVVFVNADAKKLPFAKETFDIILCTEVIEHVPNYIEVIEEIIRIAKHNAEIIITFPSKWSIDEIVGQIKGKFSFYEHINIISINNFRKLCKNYGLDIIDIKYCCFNFQLFSRLLDKLPFLIPFMKINENIIKKLPLLRNLCW